MKNLHLFIFIILLFSFNTIIAQSKAEKAIEKVKELEELYWNKGDIDGYVSLYAPESNTRMIYKGGEGVVMGKENILAFYQKYWPKDKMGTLKLDYDKLEKVSNKYYYVSGFFHVSYPDKKAVVGRFSGLMKKIKGKWYLYTDHSG